jgi:hypothetical protein
MFSRKSGFTGFPASGFQNNRISGQQDILPKLLSDASLIKRCSIDCSLVFNFLVTVLYSTFLLLGKKNLLIQRIKLKVPKHGFIGLHKNEWYR